MKNNFSILRKALRIGEDILVHTGSLLLLAIMAVTVAEIVGRTWFNQPIPGSEELPSLFLVLVATIGLAAVQRENRHIGVNIIQEILKGRAAAFYEFFLLSVLLFVSLVVAVYGWELAMDAKIRQLTTMGPLFLPTWPFKLVLPFGFGLMSLRVIIQMVREARHITFGGEAAQ